jgi:hypothetical protein
MQRATSAPRSLNCTGESQLLPIHFGDILSIQTIRSQPSQSTTRVCSAAEKMLNPLWIPMIYAPC